MSGITGKEDDDHSSSISVAKRYGWGRDKTKFGTSVQQSKVTRSLIKESNNDSGLPSGLTPSICNPKLNRAKHMFGMKCQSTVHNNTKEVVYAIVTSKMIKTTTTTNVDAKTKVGISAANTEAGLKRTRQTEKGPTPPAIIPISPSNCHTFNLDSSNYYLTFYTMKKTVLLTWRRVFHQVNVKVQGCDDYVICPGYLQHHVELDLDDEMLKFVMNASPTTTI